MTNKVALIANSYLMTGLHANELNLMFENACWATTSCCVCCHLGCLYSDNAVFSLWVRNRKKRFMNKCELSKNDGGSEFAVIPEEIILQEPCAKTCAH